MSNIKKRVQLTKIILRRGEPIITDTPKPVVDEMLNSDKQFLVFGDRTINKFNVDDVILFDVDDVENFILGLPKNKRDFMRNEIKKRNEEGKRINVQILQNILDKYGGI